jgi:hypothetical protein
MGARLISSPLGFVSFDETVLLRTQEYRLDVFRCGVTGVGYFDLW